MEPLAKRPRGPEVPADDDFRAPELTARLGLLMHQLQRERGLMTLHVADNSWGGRRAARARERLARRARAREETGPGYAARS